jgi:hypothetical protein
MRVSYLPVSGYVRMGEQGVRIGMGEFRIRSDSGGVVLHHEGHEEIGWVCGVAMGGGDASVRHHPAAFRTAFN